MAAGSQEFAELVRQYSRVVSAAVRRVCGQAYRRLIPDVEQEVYLAIWKAVGSGKKIDHPSSYLYKVALRTAVAVTRKHAAELPAEAEQIQAVAEQREDGIDQVLAVERARWLGAELDRLPVEQAQALRAYLGGFNHTEVAALHGWTESVARHRIYRGIQSLKDRMSERTP